MASTASPFRSASAGASASVLIVCLVLSVLVHIITAGGFSEYARSRPASHTQSGPEISMPDMPLPEEHEDSPIQLGRQEAKSASITWLGVLENPIEGQAPESEVEQAELAINTGDRDVSQPDVAQSQQRPEQLPDVAPQPAEQSEVVDPTQPEVAPEPQPETPNTAQAIEEQPPQAQAPPEQTAPIEQLKPSPDPELETSDAENTDPAPQPEPVEQADQDEQSLVVTVQEESADAESDQAAPEPEPEPQQEPKQDQETPAPDTAQRVRPEQAAPAASPQPEERPSAPTQQGKPGEEDDRESVATMLKRAEAHSANNLNRPLSSSGLEIKPVEPRYPASVRFTQLPRNPVVLIRFNAKGQVIFADFLRDTEKRKVYDTGSRSVDEPLLSAIYKWRAEGEPLNELDAKDPESYIEIPMKIIFREERGP